MSKKVGIQLKQAKVISVANQKGGVAKSITTQLTATWTALLGNNVLIVDIDAQADQTFINGFSEDDVIDRNIADLLLYKTDITAADIILKHKEIEGLYLLPSSIDLSMTEVDMQSQKSREKILARKLEPIMDQFDYIFIDCPPSLSILPLNAFSVSDGVIIPVKTDSLSKRGLNRLKSTIEEVKELINPKLEIYGVVATFYDWRANDDNKQLDYLRETENLLQVIPNRVAVKEGIDDGLSIIELQPDHPVSQAYKELAEKIIKEF